MLNCRLYSRLTTDLSEQQRLELGQRRGQPGRHYVPPVAVCAVAEADDLAIVVDALPPLLYGDVGPALLSDVHHGFE